MPKTKHAATLPKRRPTRHQLDRWQKQRRLQRIVMAASTFVIAAVLIFVGFGFYREEIGPRYQPAVRVDDTVYNLGYYTGVLSLYAHGQDPSLVTSIAGIVTRDVQYNELIRRASAKLGITVDPKDVDDTIQEANLSNSPEVRDLVVAQLLTAKLRTDYFGLQVPSTADQVQVQAMFLPGQKAAGDIRARLEKGDDFAAIAKDSSVEPVTKGRGGDLGWIFKELGTDIGNSTLVEDTALKMNNGELSLPLFDNVSKESGYWVIQLTSIDPETNQRKVKAILLGTPEEASQVRGKILAGDDFAKLAKEYSQDTASKEQGGDVGVLPASMSQEFKDVALALKPGETSEVVLDPSVTTKGGYWLIKVLDSQKGRNIDEAARNRLIDEAFSKWAEDLASQSKLEDYLTADKLQWAVNHIPKVKVK